MSRAANSSRGFTLMELMVAVTLLAIVLGMVTTSFVTVTTTMAISREVAEATRFRGHLRRLFTDNLSAVAPNPDLGFIGTDDAGGYGPADSLEFVCLAESAGARGLPGVTTYVRFALRDASDLAGYRLPAADQAGAARDAQRGAARAGSDAPARTQARTGWAAFCRHSERR